MGQGILDNRTSGNHARKFLPVVLGTDCNAYSIVRAIYENYGVKSISLGRMPLRFTANSRIVKQITDLHLTDDAVLMRRLNEIADHFPSATIIVIPCGDGYAEQVSRLSDQLCDRFAFNVPAPQLQRRLENKVDFYSVCEEYGLPYPSTHIITADGANSGSVHLPFDFPIALKPNDSIEYQELSFPGKKKAYKIHDQRELDSVLRDIYRAGYTGSMIAQDFIPGDASEMTVLNAYMSRSGKLRMMALGQCVLDAVNPALIGNYDALYTVDGSDIFPTFQRFLEQIGYTGYANFDLKRDPRDGTYKVFEINLRQGRSSFHMEVGGCHYVNYLIDDLLGRDDATSEPYFHTGEGKMWLYADPLVVRRYAPLAIRSQALDVMKRGYEYAWWYSKDRNFKRWIWHTRMRLNSLKTYWNYGVPASQAEPDN